ncbi:class I SAM-dependent methyltransferase [Chryseolinea sp. T2]|uniref:class I SAM-dependent methyltransferase n=1 Tax=Chryseolinea sp. T2 TaxID=3129255 RepID=UPI00307794EB
MKDQEHIIRTYNATAESYAATRIDELSAKPLDRILLREFASINLGKGKCADFGCGPGHATKFLHDNGMTDIVGIDISPEMVNTAKKYFPDIAFETGNLLELSHQDECFSSAIAFYAIVNFDHDQLTTALKEVRRVLKSGAELLLSFHVGEGVVHFDKARDIDVDVDMYFWKLDTMVELLANSGFEVITALERLPYVPVEYNSKRGYISARRR